MAALARPRGFSILASASASAEGRHKGAGARTGYTGTRSYGSVIAEAFCVGRRHLEPRLALIKGQPLRGLLLVESREHRDGQRHIRKASAPLLDVALEPTDGDSR